MMERIMLVMIVVVALVAVGGLLYVGVQKAPEFVQPVIIQGPSLQAQQVQPGQLVDQVTGQIRFSVIPPQDSVTGQIKFEVNQ